MGSKARSSWEMEMGMGVGDGLQGRALARAQRYMWVVDPQRVLHSSALITDLQHRWTLVLTSVAPCFVGLEGGRGNGDGI